MIDDLTIVYYTTKTAPKSFLAATKIHLAKAIGSTPRIDIVQSESTPRSHLQIYRNALEGAKQAKTKYIALCEDDVLYHKDHFKYRPKNGVFSYNMNVWCIYTWVKPPIFSYKDRRNLSQLICERNLFIEAMEERFAKWPDDKKVQIENWAEPGKYEENLRVSKRQSEKFYSDTPNVTFSHETALSYLYLGTRKKLGRIRALEIPYWGTAETILNLYG